MRPRLLRSSVVLSLTLVMASVVAAQDVDQYFGQTVTELRFEIEGRPGASLDLASVVDVRVGQPLVREQVRESMSHLFAQGYDQVTPVVNSTPTGVAVTFRLVPRYRISRVDIAPGDTGVSAGTLRQEVSQRFLNASTGVRLDIVEDTVERLLHDAGYLGAEASAATVVEAGATSASLLVTVRAGPLAMIGSSEVKGSSLIAAGDVLRRVGAEPGQPFRRRQIETDLTEIEDELRTKAYYEAQASLVATPSDAGVDVVIAIEAGPRVELKVVPANALPGNIDTLIPIRRQRSADQDLLEDARARIEQELRQNGYATASAPFSRELSEDGATLFVTFAIERGPRFFVDRVNLPASAVLPLQTIQSLLDVEPGQVFNPQRFETGVARIVDEYRRLGYYQSVAEPVREVVGARSTPTTTWVALDPNITEGPRGQVTDVVVTFQGDHALSEGDVRARLRSQVGAPYVEVTAALDQEAVVALYREQGFLGAMVGLQPRMSANGTAVVLAFTISEGPKIVIGRISVSGNVRVSEQQILEVLELVPGAPLSGTVLNGARQRLADMGIFRQISVRAEERLRGETEAHVIVNVVEAPTISGGFGGGLEGGTFNRTTPTGSEDRVEFSPRGFFEIGRRNLGGRNRTLSFFSRVSLKPRSVPGDPEKDGRGFGFSEYRVTGSYRERRAFRSATDLLVAVTSEQAVRSTYSSLKRFVNAEALRRLTPRLTFSIGYGLDFTRLFDERIDIEDQPLIDRLFPQLRISMITTGVAWDSRDNILTATRGAFLSADAEIAARSIGSEVGYLKTFFQASRFRRLGASPNTVVAVRGQLGVARGFARIIDASTVTNLPMSQRFFSGGGTTVRGFQLDRLGVYDPDCVAPPGDICSVIDEQTGLSVGGNAVLVGNVELRRIVGRLYGRNAAVVGFVDGGNVFVRASDINVAQMRATVGFGVRYDSPLGPLRLDFGFKLDEIDVRGQPERGWEYHLSIGEAF